MAALASSADTLGALLPLASVLPFALLLLAIALLPLCAPHWWERNLNKALVVLVMAVPFTLFLSAYGVAADHALEEGLRDYLSFVALVGSLFVIAGGVHVRGSLAGTPISNSIILGLGALLANVIGTTGASMVLIRPFLRANEKRQRRTHQVVFFIFIVSNCGGLLTPLGDPPLYLGFLKGVPFEWTLGLWKPWLLVNGLLLAIFHLIDGVVLQREEAADARPLLEQVLQHMRLRIDGKQNVLILAGVVAVIIGQGTQRWPFGVQEALLVGLALLSWFGTPGEVHSANRFAFGPIVEVAILFLGIFVTMVAPLAILNARGAHLGIDQPWQCFWAAGALSSFLDNAPTYMTFAAATAGKLGVPLDDPHYLGALLQQGARAAELLAAISAGAVFMGANTYIGNGPNFMVKAIAEGSGVRMPSFLGYMVWSLCVLIPVFVLVTFTCFR